MKSVIPTSTSLKNYNSHNMTEIKYLFFLNRFAIWSIHQYQEYTKNKRHRCLHYPSCSNYGIMAYEKYPFIIATTKVIQRFRDCHPFSSRPYLDYP